jgi:protein-tyrosine phosphatase
VIDLHCHLLPAIDDGPTTEEQSLALARAAVDAGTTTIVATPHVNWRYPGNTAASIVGAVARMQDALDRAGIALRVLTGAEIAPTWAADLHDDELSALRLGGADGTHLLVECPLSPSVAGFDAVIGHLRSRGHRIVLAHPERCPAFQRDPDAYAALVADGTLGQITASALVGRFGRPPRELAERLLRDGLATVVASDAHSVVGRPPSMRAELEQAGFGAQAAWLTHDVPAALVAGHAPPPAPQMMPERQATGLRRLFSR